MVRNCEIVADEAVKQSARDVYAFAQALDACARQADGRQDELLVFGRICSDASAAEDLVCSGSVLTSARSVRHHHVHLGFGGTTGWKAGYVGPGKRPRVWLAAARSVSISSRGM